MTNLIKRILLMSAGTLCCSIVVFGIYYFALHIPARALLTPWLLSFILGVACCPLLDLGRERIIRTKDTKLFYFAAGLYLLCQWILIVYYATRFGYGSTNHMSHYCLIAVVSVMAIMVTAFYLHRSLFNPFSS